MICVSNHEDMGRRVRRTAQVYTGSAWVELPVDGDQKLVYDRWNVIQVLDANNGDAVVRTYTWGLDLSGLSGEGSVAGVHGAGGIGGLLAVEVPQATGESRKYGYLYDGNGNVVQLVEYQNASETATLATHYEYDAYGRTAYAVNYDDGSAAAANPFRFSTKWLEDQTSANGFLYYYGYRYYSPRLGRWISRDPIEEKGGLNVVGFGANASPNAWDAFGLSFMCGAVPCEEYHPKQPSVVYSGCPDISTPAGKNLDTAAQSGCECITKVRDLFSDVDKLSKARKKCGNQYPYTLLNGVIQSHQVAEIASTLECMTRECEHLTIHCPCSCDDGVYAYVDTWWFIDFKTINVCHSFYQQDPSNQAMTIMHELGHVCHQRHGSAPWHLDPYQLQQILHGVCFNYDECVD